MIEGGPAEQLRRDQGPWNAEKIKVKVLKGIVCGSMVWILASTAVVYCVGTQAWLSMITGSPLENWTPFVMTVIMMAFLTFQFGWFREQFCTVLCPYARFQSVLLDPHSLLVGYDRARGEPRGKPGKVKIADSASVSAQQASTFVTACNSSASNAVLARTPATR
jgi:polyferredoxin